jgi:hypothetical protein
LLLNRAHEQRGRGKNLLSAFFSPAFCSWILGVKRIGASDRKERQMLFTGFWWRGLSSVDPTIWFLRFALYQQRSILKQNSAIGTEIYAVRINCSQKFVLYYKSFSTDCQVYF